MDVWIDRESERVAKRRKKPKRQKVMSAVGFEPTSANTVELESTPLDRSGTLTIMDSHHTLIQTHTHKHQPCTRNNNTTHTHTTHHIHCRRSIHTIAFSYPTRASLPHTTHTLSISHIHNTVFHTHTPPFHHSTNRTLYPPLPSTSGRTNLRSCSCSRGQGRYLSFGSLYRHSLLSARSPMV